METALDPAAPSRPQRTTARDHLVLDHQGLAHALARRFANRGETFEDLVQVALLGLVKAADRFDPDRSIQFSTFATATITGELKRHFRDKRWGLHVPRSAQERYLLVRDATEWAREDMGRTPTTAEIAQRAGMSEEEVMQAQSLSSAFHLDSLDSPGIDGRESPHLADPGNALDGVDGWVSLTASFARLPARERQILALRFIDELPQSEIADRLHISQMQVSRILRRTLARLRMALVVPDTEPETEPETAPESSAP